MAYIAITDFKYGMDRRRERVTGIPGTLWVGKNVVITRGGDIERTKKFVPQYSLPADQTFGMGQVRGQLYVFGSVASPAVPLGVQYQQLSAPDGAAMVGVLDVRTVDAKLYVIAKYDNGNIYHFYDGARVTDWDTISAANTTLNTLTAYLADLIDSDADVTARAYGDTITIVARVPGAEFVYEKSTTDFGGTSDEDVTFTVVQANVPAVSEVQATSIVAIVSGTSSPGVNTIADITVNGTSLMQAAVDWTTSNTITAGLVAVQINNKTAAHGYTALASGDNIILTAAAGTGATPNEYVVAASTSGNVLLHCPTMSGGVTAVAGVAQVISAQLIGTFEAADLFEITINGRTYSATGRAAATGQSLFIGKRRVWSPANSLWHYCKLNTPSDWADANPSIGAGFINVSNESEGSERLVGATYFGSQAAVFARENAQIFEINTDAELVELAQPVSNSGAIAARAIIPYGNLDVYYLNESGVRSLRQHASNGTAYASDVGNPIDNFLRAYMDAFSDAELRRAVAVIGPEGRYWLAVSDRIFILSYFPGSKITAWTYADPGFAISDLICTRNQLYARSADTIYLYGGAGGTTYPGDDETEAEVSTPFITAQAPATVKQILGFDIGCTGTWDCRVLVDPNDENKYVSIGKVNKTTYNGPHIGLPGLTTHVAFRLTCSKSGRATISNMAIHYDPVEAR